MTSYYGKGASLCRLCSTLNRLVTSYNTTATPPVRLNTDFKPSDSWPLEVIELFVRCVVGLVSVSLV